MHIFGYRVLDQDQVSRLKGAGNDVVSKLSLKTRSSRETTLYNVVSNVCKVLIMHLELAHASGDEVNG